MRQFKPFRTLALLASTLATAVAWAGGSAAAQDRCDQLQRQFDGSSRNPFDVSGVMADLDGGPDGFDFFLEVDCDLNNFGVIMIVTPTRPTCADGSRVTVRGVVTDAGMPTMEASRVRCN